MSYENKILQMKKMLGKKPVTAKQKVEEPAFQKPARPSYTEQWKRAGLTVVENDFGIVFKRQVSYPFSYQHGHYQLNTFFEALKNGKMLSLIILMRSIWGGSLYYFLIRKQQV